MTSRRGFFRGLIAAVAIATCPKLDLPCLKLDPIAPFPRRLKTRWSVELEQDLTYIHGANIDILP